MNAIQNKIANEFINHLYDYYPVSMINIHKYRNYGIIINFKYKRYLTFVLLSASITSEDEVVGIISSAGNGIKVSCKENNTLEERRKLFKNVIDTSEEKNVDDRK